jgi:hypothetical protein
MVNKNTTKKKKKSIQNKKYYDLYFKNTHYIPITNIIKYMKINFNQFLQYKIQKEKENKYALSLEDCFQISPDLFTGNSLCDIDTSLLMNPNMSLDKLISYIFYLKSEQFFINNKNEVTSLKEFLNFLKYQMGKDIRRDDRTINNIEYNRNLFSDLSKTNYQITDMFYDIILKYIHLYDYNIVNKIGLLSCQNMFGFITDIITIKILDIISPETNSVFRPDKNMKITINKNECNFEYYFKSQLIISREGLLDPEYPCGNLEFNMVIDLIHNTYKLSSFILNYDLNKCGNPSINNQNNNNNQNQNNQNNQNITTVNKNKYLLPAIGLGIGGILSVPFLLGGGGRKKKKKNKKTKKRKK